MKYCANINYKNYSNNPLEILECDNIHTLYNACLYRMRVKDNWNDYTIDYCVIHSKTHVYVMDRSAENKIRVKRYKKH